jgi:hypothetical protein
MNNNLDNSENFYAMLSVSKQSKIKKYILENPITPNLEWDFEVHPKNVNVEEIKSHITNMASVLGIEGVIKLHICKDLFGGGSGMYWYKHQVISLNYPFGNLKRTLAHEFFHHFQNTQGIVKLLDIKEGLYEYNGNKIRYDSQSSSSSLYSENPIEKDANEFADWFCKNY